MILFEEKRRQQKFYSTFSFYLEAEAESAWSPLPHKLRTTLYIFPSLPASPFRLPLPSPSVFVFTPRDSVPLPIHFRGKLICRKQLEHVE